MGKGGQKYTRKQNGAIVSDDIKDFLFSHFVININFNEGNKYEIIGWVQILEK